LFRFLVGEAIASFYKLEVEPSAVTKTPNKKNSRSAKKEADRFPTREVQLLDISIADNLML